MRNGYQKQDWKSLAFCLKSVVNLFSWTVDGMLDNSNLFREQ